MVNLNLEFVTVNILFVQRVNADDYALNLPRVMISQVTREKNVPVINTPVFRTALYSSITNISRNKMCFRRRERNHLMNELKRAI